MTIQEITARIQEHPNMHRPILIAIDGFGGAGKSTTARELKDTLGDAYVISIDDFIIKEKLQEQTADESYFDRRRLEVEVLKPAENDQAITYRRLEWTENRLSTPITAPHSTYLIIEGISTFHPDIAHYFDYKIWINVPIEIAKQRGRERDSGNENEQYWDLWAANDVRYQEKYHPEKQADFVIENGLLH